MLLRLRAMLVGLAVIAAAAAPSLAVTDVLEEGSIELTSAGPLAFAPDGVLLVSDPMAATIYAVATEDNSGDPSSVNLNVDDIRGKLASMLGTVAKDIQVKDLAVNPHSGNAYLSVTRGSGPEAAAVLFRINAQGDISEFSLKNVRHAKAALPNPPESQSSRRGDPRMLAITDMAYVDGRVFIAGLSNEEFASKLRSIPFPFAEADDGTSVEIFHGAHGRIETRSPIMTFTSYEIDQKPHVVAAYTCTPLVKFPVSELKPGIKVRGTTVAELGNRNRPLDMFVYENGGRTYILMANSSRGVMKISTENIGGTEPITEHVSGGNTAGLPYDTIEELKGVLQLDRLNETSALALVQAEDGSENLRTIPLP